MRMIKRDQEAKTDICPLCGESFDIKHGHNPAPLEVEGNVCDNCQTNYVIPARLEALGMRNKEKAEDSVPFSFEALSTEAGKPIDIMKRGTHDSQVRLYSKGTFVGTYDFLTGELDLAKIAQDSEALRPKVKR